MSARHIATSISDNRPLCGAKSRRVYSGGWYSLDFRKLHVCKKCEHLFKEKTVERALTESEATWLRLKSPTA